VVVAVTHLLTREVCLLAALVEVRATVVEVVMLLSELVQAYLVELEIFQMIKTVWSLLLVAAVVVVGTHLLAQEVLTHLLVKVINLNLTSYIN